MISLYRFLLILFVLQIECEKSFYGLLKNVAGPAALHYHNRLKFVEKNMVGFKNKVV